jgi:hypothetical protein
MKGLGEDIAGHGSFPNGFENEGNENEYCHHIDFGNCDAMNVMGDFLKALDRTVELPIHTLVVGA